MVYRTDLKGFAQSGRTIKVRVNPKKPNQCCKTYPDMSGLFMCLSFAVVVLYDEWKPEYKSYADGMDAHRSQRVPTGHTFVRHKYKGLVMKTKVKSFWLWEGAKIKVRVNPKKPNECCMPSPRLGGLIGCWIFSAFWLYMCFYTL